MRDGTWVWVTRLMRLEELPGRAVVAPKDIPAPGWPRREGGRCCVEPRLCDCAIDCVRVWLPSSERISVIRDEIPPGDGGRGILRPAVGPGTDESAMAGRRGCRFQVREFFFRGDYAIAIRAWSSVIHRTNNWFVVDSVPAREKVVVARWR